VAWESRGQNRFYYRKRRRGRRVVSEYVGADELAEALALNDCLERMEREQAHADVRSEQTQERLVDAQLDQVLAHVRALASVALLINGYHEHRGQWRKERMAKSNGLQEFNALVDKVDKENASPENVQAFRRFMDHLPADLALIDLSELAFVAASKPLTGDKRSTAEYVVQERKKKLTELGYGEASPLERL
jgi:hypothetical protein